MAVTGEDVFNLAIVLMDEVTDNGTVNAADTEYYRGKTPAILTTLQSELLPISETPAIIKDLTQNLSVSDRLAIQVLPYGLAANFLLTEDLAVASFFNARFDELKKKIPTTIEPITDNLDVLGGLQ